MTWSAVFIVFFVSHQLGDYLLQTEWQAMHKRGGLGRSPLATKALLSHTRNYAIGYVPAFIWISSGLGWNTLIVVAAVVIPHLVQDDGRALRAYMRRVKGMDPDVNHTVAALVDQALHMVALLGAALLVSALL